MERKKAKEMAQTGLHSLWEADLCHKWDVRAVRNLVDREKKQKEQKKFIVTASYW